MEWYDKLALTIAGLGTLVLGSLTLLKMDLVLQYLPDYATYVYVLIVAAGIYTGYFALFKKK